MSLCVLYEQNICSPNLPAKNCFVSSFNLTMDSLSPSLQCSSLPCDQKKSSRPLTWKFKSDYSFTWGHFKSFFFFFSLVKHKWFSGYTSVWFIFDLKLHKCFSVCCMHFYTYMLYIIRSKAYRKVFAKISGIVGN